MEQHQEEPEGQGGQQQECVLLVDPSPSLYQQVYQELSEWYEVRHALTAAEAMQSIEQSVPALLISEIDLPDLSGLALCEQLRAQPATRKLPILFLTTRGGIGEKMAGFAAGADDYLVKPIDRRFFSARVRLLFRIKALEQQRPPGL
jgi:DNA-binding response OmpR family regulator